MAVFICSKCQHTQTVDDKYIGRPATCPKCKSHGVVEHGIPSASFQPPFDSGKSLVHANGGHLGIRCDSWMDSKRHINLDSSLRIDWWTVLDDTLPMRFSGPCGVRVNNHSDDYPLVLAYHATTRIVCHDVPVTSFEVRYMTFNVWGEHVRTLVACEIFDFDAGERGEWQHKWGLFSENEADELCASLSFVSRVRLASGVVMNADLSFALREAQRISEKVTADDLEQKAPKKE